jgi:hypothetical protein
MVNARYLAGWSSIDQKEMQPSDTCHGWACHVASQIRPPPLPPGLLLLLLRLARCLLPPAAA